MYKITSLFPATYNAFSLFRLMDSFAVRERQRGRSRRAAQSFAKSSAVVRERQIDYKCTKQGKRIMK